MTDISKLAKLSGIDAQKTATQMFGMAVEQFGASPLTKIINDATGNSSSARKKDGSWYASSYASSMVNSQFRPKLKFLFRVEFLFHPDVLKAYGGQAKWQNNFSFLVKSVDRPKIDFEYEEVNKYNFRTKILKRIVHKDLSMSFIDDVGNNSYEFFRFMMMVHSPITRRSIYASQDITKAHATYTDGSGMVFTEGLGKSNDYAHRGVVNTDAGQPIQAIKVTQLFVNQTEKLDSSTKQVSFFFINPRMVSFDLDELNHESSEHNSFTMNFDFDFMVMSKMDSMEKLDTKKMVPPAGTAPGDAVPYGTGDKKTSASDPYTSLLAGIGGKAAQKLTSELLGKNIRKIPGLGSVADTLSSAASGLVSRGISDGVGLAVNSVKQSFARPSAAVVSDSSVAGSVHADYSTSTKSGFGADQASASNGSA